MKITISILTVSDRCSQGVAEDVSGRTIKELVLSCPELTVLRYGIVPDDKDKIQVSD